MIPPSNTEKAIALAINAQLELMRSNLYSLPSFVDWLNGRTSYDAPSFAFDTSGEVKLQRYIKFLQAECNKVEDLAAAQEELKKAQVNREVDKVFARPAAS